MTHHGTAELTDLVEKFESLLIPKISGAVKELVGQIASSDEAPSSTMRLGEELAMHDLSLVTVPMTEFLAEEKTKQEDVDRWANSLSNQLQCRARDLAIDLKENPKGVKEAERDFIKAAAMVLALMMLESEAQTAERNAMH